MITSRGLGVLLEEYSYMGYSYMGYSYMGYSLRGGGTWGTPSYMGYSLTRAAAMTTRWISLVPS